MGSDEEYPDEDKTIYDDEVSEEMSEDDVITGDEEGFMKGYSDKEEKDEEEEGFKEGDEEEFGEE